MNNIQIKKKEILEKLSQPIKVYLQHLLSYVTKDGIHISAYLKIVNHKNLYILKPQSIIKALPFYSKEELNDSQDFFKKELKKIISTVQDKLIKHNDNNEITF